MCTHQGRGSSNRFSILNIRNRGAVIVQPPWELWVYSARISLIFTCVFKRNWGFNNVVFCCQFRIRGGLVVDPILISERNKVKGRSVATERLSDFVSRRSGCRSHGAKRSRKNEV